MSFSNILRHCVWSRKNREPSLLNKEIRKTLFTHIREQARSKGIYIDFVGGYHDHVHILLKLDVDQQISIVIKGIKGESSYWFNHRAGICSKLEWQDDYFVVSVS